MQSIVMHIRPRYTHPLSLMQRPIGDIFIKALVVVSDMTLDNKICWGVQHIPQK